MNKRESRIRRLVAEATARDEMHGRLGSIAVYDPQTGEVISQDPPDLPPVLFLPDNGRRPVSTRRPTRPNGRNGAE